jgi:hypothetical protein
MDYARGVFSLREGIAGITGKQGTIFILAGLSLAALPERLPAVDWTRPIQPKYNSRPQPLSTQLLRNL